MIKVSRKLIFQETENLPILLSSFTAIPIQNKYYSGIEISDLSDNQIATKLKLKENDILLALDNQKLEDVVKIKQDEYQMHYRRKYNHPLEDPRNGLGISCPFVKIPIFSGAFDDINDPLYIFKAMSKNRYKVFKDLGNNDKQDLNISSTSIGQDSETKTMGYFKGLTRIIEKNQMNEYQKFVKNMEGKVPINYLSHYDEISKNILVSKEVIVRVYTYNTLK